MSQTYELNKQINDLLPKVAQRHGIKIEIELTNKALVTMTSYSKEFYSVCIGENQDLKLQRNYICPLIEAPQIKQILNALKGVLGENPKYTLFVGLDDNWHATNSRNDIFASVHKTKSDALCAKWLDSLNPLIDTNPEQVLSELVDVLNQLLD